MAKEDVPLLVGLVYDLRDDYLAEGFSAEDVAEFDSLETIDALDSAIKSLGFRTQRVGHGRSLAKRLACEERWDLVFNIAEGVRGRNREALVPALLELYDVNYTFSDPLVCALTLDKAMAKRVIQSEQLLTPRFFVVRSESDISSVALNYPLFAKPIAEGTGKGVDAQSKIDDLSQLQSTCSRLLSQYNQPVLVEEYLSGREFTTAILGSGDSASVLGTMEFTIDGNAPAKDYSYEVKELCEQFVKYFPMPKGTLRDEVEGLALSAHRVLGARDASRVDIRLDSSGRPAFLEINPLPGLHPYHSDLPMIATQEGLPYPVLIGSIIESALRRA